MVLIDPKNDYICASSCAIAGNRPPDLVQNWS
jgi:hypothetical protein